MQNFRTLGAPPPDPSAFGVYAKCNSCRIDISVARGGTNDVTKHVTFENHKKRIAAEKRNQWITSFMVKGPEESDKLMWKQNL